jgi:hypothetical protein
MRRALRTFSAVLVWISLSSTPPSPLVGLLPSAEGDEGSPPAPAPSQTRQARFSRTRRASETRSGRTCADARIAVQRVEHLGGFAANQLDARGTGRAALCASGARSRCGARTALFQQKTTQRSASGNQSEAQARSQQENERTRQDSPAAPGRGRRSVAAPRPRSWTCAREQLRIRPWPCRRSSRQRLGQRRGPPSLRHTRGIRHVKR